MGPAFGQAPRPRKKSEAYRLDYPVECLFRVKTHRSSDGEHTADEPPKAVGLVQHRERGMSARSGPGPAQHTLGQKKPIFDHPELAGC